MTLVDLSTMFKLKFLKIGIPTIIDKIMKIPNKETKNFLFIK